MKKKIALLLAAAMTVSMLPMSAMAGSTNTISVTANVKTNEAVKVNGYRLSHLIQSLLTHLSFSTSKTVNTTKNTSQNVHTRLTMVNLMTQFTTTMLTIQKLVLRHM